MGVDCPLCDRTLVSTKGAGQHVSRTHGENYLLAEYGADWLAEQYADRSENALAEQLGVSRPALKAALEEAGIDRRGQSDAEEHKWERMDADQRHAQVRAAHEATRGHPRLDTSVNGYERIRHGDAACKHHRLLAVAEYGFDAVRGAHVHHENGIPWDNRPENITPLAPSEHRRLHAKERQDPDTGRFT